MLANPSINSLRNTIFKRSVLDNKYIIHKPTIKQAQFCALDCLEALYGGAAGGGKSDALLMAALQYVDIPTYNAILFRKSLQDHNLPEGLIPRSHEWLGPTDAHWNGTLHRWSFPSGATLTFGYLDNVQDKYKYQSAAFQYIGFDELTQFLEPSYTYLLSRLRRLEGYYVPLRVRNASNPGNIGHDWVKARFIDPESCEDRVFIPALLEDNPYLDRVQYEKSLNQLDEVTRQQLRWGNWDVRPEGGKFKREWFDIVDAVPPYGRLLRYWDTASTAPKAGYDPDWTCGLLVKWVQGVLYIMDVQRFRANPFTVEQRVGSTAARDGLKVDIYMEEEPGSSGKAMISHYSRNVVSGYPFRGHRTTGSKEIRANPLSAAAQNGNVKLLRGGWNRDFLNELEAFPMGSHDDQVDAASGAFEKLTSVPHGAFF
jgi:predicted phage terminase large subunit-like protein